MFQLMSIQCYLLFRLVFDDDDDDVVVAAGMLNVSVFSCSPPPVEQCSDHLSDEIFVGGFQRGVFARGGNLNNWGGCAHRLQ